MAFKSYKHYKDYSTLTHWITSISKTREIKELPNGHLPSVFNKPTSPTQIQNVHLKTDGENCIWTWTTWNWSYKTRQEYTQVNRLNRLSVTDRSSINTFAVCQEVMTTCTNQTISLHPVSSLSALSLLLWRPTNQTRDNLTFDPSGELPVVPPPFHGEFHCIDSNIRQVRWFINVNICTNTNLYASNRKHFLEPFQGFCQVFMSKKTLRKTKDSLTNENPDRMNYTNMGFMFCFNSLCSSSTKYLHQQLLQSLILGSISTEKSVLGNWSSFVFGLEQHAGGRSVWVDVDSRLAAVVSLSWTEVAQQLISAGRNTNKINEVKLRRNQFDCRQM